MRCKAACELAHEHQQGCLAAGIVRQVARRGGVQRGEKQHAAGDAVGDHVARHMPGDVKAGSHVDAVHRIPDFGLHLIPPVRLAAPRRSTVDQHMQRSQSASGLVDCHQACSGYCKVDQRPVSTQTLTAQRAKGRAQGISLHIDEKNRCSLEGDSAGKCAADAVTGTGDERCLSTQGGRRRSPHLSPCYARAMACP